MGERTNTVRTLGSKGGDAVPPGTFRRWHGRGSLQIPDCLPEENHCQVGKSLSLSSRVLPEGHIRPKFLRFLALSPTFPANFSVPSSSADHFTLAGSIPAGTPATVVAEIGRYFRVATDLRPSQEPAYVGGGIADRLLPKSHKAQAVGAQLGERVSRPERDRPVRAPLGK